LKLAAHENTLPRSNSATVPATALTGRKPNVKESLKTKNNRSLKTVTLTISVAVTPLKVGVAQAEPFQWRGASAPLQMNRNEPPAVVILTD
jgi:hypothetical protein